MTRRPRFQILQDARDRKTRAMQEGDYLMAELLRELIFEIEESSGGPPGEVPEGIPVRDVTRKTLREATLAFLMASGIDRESIDLEPTGILETVSGSLFELLKTQQWDPKGFKMGIPGWNRARWSYTVDSRTGIFRFTIHPACSGLPHEAKILDTANDMARILTEAGYPTCVNRLK